MGWFSGNKPDIIFGNYKGQAQYHAKCGCGKEVGSPNEKDVQNFLKACRSRHPKVRRGWASGGKKVVKAATWRKRKSRGECACGCGKPAKPGDNFRAGCARKVVLEGSEEYRELEARVRKGVDKSIPPGQNPNGLVYDIDGNRVFPFEYE